MAIRVELPLWSRVARWLLAVMAAIVGLYASMQFGRDLGKRELSASDQEVADLRSRVSNAESELERLRTVSATTDSRIQVEKSAQGQLVRQLKQVEAENARLKEELAFFENLVPGGKAAAMSIQNLRVEPADSPGEYRYRMLVVLGDAQQGQEFKGHVQLLVNVQRDDRPAVLTIPDPKSPGDGNYRLNIRRMQRVEGVFRVEPSARVSSVQVRVMEQGASQPRATRTVSPG